MTVSPDRGQALSSASPNASVDCTCATWAPRSLRQRQQVLLLRRTKEALEVCCVLGNGQKIEDTAAMIVDDDDNERNVELLRHL